jgi:calcineurin-like phosphoesterase family protein
VRSNKRSKGEVMTTFFTADEHYGHTNIIKYCNRPFDNVDQMDDFIIANHNMVVGESDTVIHGGDFTLSKKPTAQNYVRRLNGKHIFLSGSHDYWLGKKYEAKILEWKEEKRQTIICHYCMRTWHRSHFNSWHLYGHSHGTLPPIGKSWDIGVDNNNFYPLSFEQIKQIMRHRPNNPNFIKK